MMDRRLSFELVDVRTEDKRAIAKIEGSRLLNEESHHYHVIREPEIISKLPIVQNGPPGTFVVFEDGARPECPCQPTRSSLPMTRAGVRASVSAA